MIAEKDDEVQALRDDVAMYKRLNADLLNAQYGADVAGGGADEDSP